ncbi:MAG TPA: hypothetical protein PLP24_06210 [Acetivibrio thermocellus]|nr:hypothetical protein [Acetivibrio thermocellus]
MKRIFALWLAMTLIFVLSGCKSVESSSSNNEPPPAETMANERNNEKKML